MNKILGNRINALRREKHFTRKQVADKIGMSCQKYVSIENGTNNITMEVLFQIANVLEVQVADITKALDENFDIKHRSDDTSISLNKITDMLELFYANKHLYEKLQYM